METDVIVVGAGLAGLSAADWLLSHDLSLRVLVLEASDRVGGRILSVRSSSGHTFDLGGQWMCSQHKNLLQIVDKLGLRTEFTNVDGGLKKVIQVGRKGRLRKTKAEPGHMILPRRPGRYTGLRTWLARLELSYTLWKLDGLCAKINDLADPYNSSDLPRDLAQELDSTTVDTYLRQNTRFKAVRDILEIQMRLLVGADLNRVSVLFLLVYVKWQGVTTFHEFVHGVKSDPGTLPPMSVAKGAQEICHQLVEQCIGPDNIVYNQPVQTVSYSADNKSRPSDTSLAVCVTTKDGQRYACSHVIMAVPPNLLRQIEFWPNLGPVKRHLLDGMSMGCAMKFYAAYDKRYWTDCGFSGEFVSNGGLTAGPITWMTDGTLSNGGPALVGILGGFSSLKWASMPEDDVKAAIVDQLVTLFGTSLGEPLDIELKFWQDEPFVCGGSLAYPAIATMRAYSEMRKPHGPVFFAGTETATRFVGTMSGAVQSGQRAAIEVLTGLRPQCLTSQDFHLLKEGQSDIFDDNDGTSTSTTWNGYSVFRWAVLLPATVLAISYAAVKLRASYGHLVVPMKW